MNINRLKNQSKKESKLPQVMVNRAKVSQYSYIDMEDAYRRKSCNFYILQWYRGIIVKKQEQKSARGRGGGGRESVGFIYRMRTDKNRQNHRHSHHAHPSGLKV